MRYQQKGALLTMKGPVPDDLAGIVDAGRLFQVPTGMRRDQLVEIGHLPVTLDEIVVDNVVAGRDLLPADDHTRRVDHQTGAVVTARAERAQVLHNAVLPEKGVYGKLGSDHFHHFVTNTISRNGASRKNGVG